MITNFQLAKSSPQERERGTESKTSPSLSVQSASRSTKKDSSADGHYPATAPNATKTMTLPRRGEIKGHHGGGYLSQQRVSIKTVATFVSISVLVLGLGCIQKENWYIGSIKESRENVSEKLYRIAPLSPNCLSHVHTLDQKVKKYGTRFKQSCKFMPLSPLEVASSSACSEEQWKVQKHIDSFQQEKESIKRYVMFIATAHSGHSLVGSLLDAHPMMLVANEDDVFSRYLKYHSNSYPSTPLETRGEIFESILSNSLKCALYGRWQHAYNYTVPHGWGGDWKPGKLAVIGDKKGGTTAKRLRALHSEKKMVKVFQEFQTTISLPIHIIHVFWDRNSDVYRKNDKLVSILRSGISSDILSASEWDNSVYTCGDRNSQESLIMETCDALGVPCDSTVMNLWVSMAKCKLADKHVAGDSISISQHNHTGAEQNTHANMGVNISILEKDGVEKDMPDHRGANNFTRFVSYGQPRSASTLQFNMVCVCFFLHMKVYKPTLANSTKCYYQGETNYNYPSLDLPQGKYSFDAKGRGLLVCHKDILTTSLHFQQ